MPKRKNFKINPELDKSMFLKNNSNNNVLFFHEQQNRLAQSVSPRFMNNVADFEILEDRMIEEGKYATKKLVPAKWDLPYQRTKELLKKS